MKLLVCGVEREFVEVKDEVRSVDLRVFKCEIPFEYDSNDHLVVSLREHLENEWSASVVLRNSKKKRITEASITYATFGESPQEILDEWFDRARRISAVLDCLKVPT